MPKSFCLLMTLLLLSPSATAEIFKCSRENGTTVYQNFPCNIDSIGSSATATAPPEQEAVPKSPPAEALPKVASRQVANTAQSAVGAAGEPRIGMTAAQVRASGWGEPVSMVTEERAEEVVQKWSYGGTRAVILDHRRRVIGVER